MTLPDQTPRLAKWPFLVGDAVLLLAAGLTAHYAKDPFTGAPLIAIVGLVVVAAILGTVPFLTDYARAQDEALDDRQRSLEALARTVNTSAEQISIAANGLKEIGELTQKALRHADHLPKQLHDRIADFQTQLAAANDAEKDELEKEVAELRAAESERLLTAADKIGKSATEWTKLEAATQKHLAVATDALSKAAATAEQLLTKAQTQAAATLDEKLAAASTALSAATADSQRKLSTTSAETLAALDAKLAQLEAKIAELNTAAKKLAETPVPVAPPATPTPILASTAGIPPPPAEATAPAADQPLTEPAPKLEATAHPPKRPRKPRRTEPTAEEPAPPAPEPAPAPVETPAVDTTAEPPPVSAEKIPEVAPAVPETTEPFAETAATPAEPTPAAPAPEPAEIVAEAVPAPPAEPPSESAAPTPAETPADTPKPPRKRAAKKTEPAPEPAPEPEPSLGLEEHPAPPPAAEVTERALSSDGATRLLVTAYIGIGNRLFIRGDGPGLSWEKGVPLQFVSIGKWRWETANATAPVKFKLYKNDETECTALGPQSLDPGQQQEMTAAF